MATKIKTQTSQPVHTPAVTPVQVQPQWWQPTPFDNQETTSEESFGFDSPSAGAAAPPPPAEVQLKSATKGYDFSKISISNFVPVKVQAKLVVGAPNDKYEKEADAMAEKVMCMTTPANSQPIQTSREAEDTEVQRQPLAETIQRDYEDEGITLKPLAETIQRDYEDEDINLKPLAETIQRDYEDEGITLKPLAETIQRDYEDEGITLKPLAETIQRDYEDEGITLKPLTEDITPYKSSPKQTINRDVKLSSKEGAFQASQSVESRLKGSQGGGKPLPDNTRQFMESRFGNDFSDVKVHTGPQSVQMNKELGAKAFTHGKNIHFNSGHYNPESNSGKSLLAHELTHTIQQTGPSPLQTKPLDSKQSKNNKQKESKIRRKKLPTYLLAEKIQKEEEQDQISTKTIIDSQQPNSSQKTTQKQEQTPNYLQEKEQSSPLSIIQRSSINSPVANQISSVNSAGSVVQRGKKKDIEKAKKKAEEKMADEIKKEKEENPGGDFSQAEETRNKAKKQAEKTKKMADNAKDEDEAESQGDKLESESEKVSDEDQQEKEKTKEKNKTALEKALEKTKAMAEKAKQKADELAEQGVEGEGQEEQVEGQEEQVEGQEEQVEGQEEQVEGQEEQVEGQEAETGPVDIPKQTDNTAPESPDRDPAFQSVIKQTENVATEQSSHKPAEEKSKEAQDAAVDENQQMRLAQATQTEEAGEKEPGIFDRESFVSALLSILEQNAPQTQEEVEEGKGVSGDATDAMKEQISKEKETAGGGVDTSATRDPDPNAEEPKEVIPTPDPLLEAGDPPPTDTIDPEAATPKTKTEEEIEGPAQEIGAALDNLVPDKLQKKMMVGAPGDKYEQEADRMAAKVMSMPDVTTSPSEAISESPATKPNKIQNAKLTTDTESEATEEPVSKDLQFVEPNQYVQREKSEQYLPIGPVLQLAPGLFVQMKMDSDEASASINQDDNEVPIDKHRMEMYEKEAGVDASGAIKDAKKQVTETGPQKFRQQEQETQGKTKEQQSTNILQKQQEMFTTKQTEFQNVKSTQDQQQQQDEGERARVTQEIQAIYDETKINVNGILARMDARVNAEFERTNKRARARFEATQKREFAKWKQDYYKNRHPLLIPWMEIKTGWAYVKIKFYLKKFFNTPLWLVNKIFTGLPDEVNQIYQVAKQEFIEEQKQGVYRIADIVEEEMNNAKAEVDRGRERVASYVAQLPESLKEVGAQAALSVQAQFDSLEQSVKDKQNQLVDELTAKYEESIKEIDARIEELKAANESFVSKAVKFIGEIAKWILKKVLSVLKPVLHKIPGVGSKADKFLDAFVDDPGGFMSNLFKGIGEGFKGFMNNIETHLKNAFFEWLLGAGIDIQFPDKFDLKGILDIVLQVLGLTTDYLFQLAGQFWPSWAATLLQMVIEKGASVFSDIEATLLEMGLPSLVISFFKALIEIPTKGIIALWDFLKDGFATLKETFMSSVMFEVVIPQIVIAGVQWLLGLMNPASGIIKILKAVVDVIIFFITNIDTIKSVLESIGNTFEAIISGATSLIAKAVEVALADILPLALGLFVALLGLGAIPAAVKKVIKTLRKPVDKTVGAIIKKIGKFFDKVAGKVKSAFGGKKDEDSAKERAEDAADEIEKKAESVREPKSVEKSLSGIKKKYQLDKIDYDGPGKQFWNNERYYVDGKATQIKTETKDASGKSSSKTTKAKRSPSTNAIPEIQPQLETEIQQSQGKGNKLPPKIQRSMEGAFDRDFSEVRIHTDAQGDRLSRSLNAKAFTVDNDIYFRQGDYQPDTIQGKKLLAHELTHVAQNKGETSPNLVQRKEINWKDKKKALQIEEKVSGSKKKASFSIKVKLISQDDILPKAKKDLTKIIKKYKKFSSVRGKIAPIKKKYNLKSITSKQLDASGLQYQIVATIPSQSETKGQRKARSNSTPEYIAADVESVIQRSQGKGQELHASTKDSMEQAFGYDFGKVKIHHNQEADYINRSLDALAFTTGKDIYFRQGAYQPDTIQGKKLLAHELTHVVQQAGGNVQMSVERDRGTVGGINTDAHQFFSLDSPNSTVQRQPLPSSNDNLIQRAMLATGGRKLGESLGAALSGSKKVKSIKHQYGSGKTSLILTVTLDYKDKKNKDLFDLDESEEEGAVIPEEIPDDILQDITIVLRAIVNQSPSPDIVRAKLEDVRRFYDLRLLTITGVGFVADSIEYDIVAKGKATNNKPGNVIKLILDIQKKHGGKENSGSSTAQTKPIQTKPLEQKERSDSDRGQSTLDIQRKSEDSVIQRGPLAKFGRSLGQSAGKKLEDKFSGNKEKDENKAQDLEEPEDTQEQEETKALESELEKEEKEETTKNKPSKEKSAKGKKSRPLSFDVNVKVIKNASDPSTVNMKIRANPQK